MIYLSVYYSDSQISQRERKEEKGRGKIFEFEIVLKISNKKINYKTRKKLYSV